MYKKPNVGIVETAIQKAIRLLDAIGVQYAIVTDGGKHYGNIDVQIRKRHGYSKELAQTTGWPEKLDKIKVGEVMVFDAADKDQAKKLVHSIASGLTNRFGKGNGMATAVERNGKWYVEVLVIAKDPKAKYAHLANGGRKHHYKAA